MDPIASKMSNSSIIFLQNSAVDALHAGDLEKGFKILSETFYSAIKDHRQSHNLTSDTGLASTLQFRLQDCSRNLKRAIEPRNDIVSVSDDDSSQFLCLNLLRMQIPDDYDSRRDIDELCSCTVAWALGYNLSIIYAVMGSIRGTGGNILFKKALRMLHPIKRQILLQRTTSAFWSNLKLCILNNYICLQRQCGSFDIAQAMQNMEKILVQSRSHLDPVDVKKYYLSMQFLNVCTSLAAAA